MSLVFISFSLSPPTPLSLSLSLSLSLFNMHTGGEGAESLPHLCSPDIAPPFLEYLLRIQ